MVETTAVGLDIPVSKQARTRLIQMIEVTKPTMRDQCRGDRLESRVRVLRQGNEWIPPWPMSKEGEGRQILGPTQHRINQDPVGAHVDDEGRISEEVDSHCRQSFPGLLGHM